MDLIIPSVINYLFSTGIDKLVDRFGESFERIIEDSIAELSKVSPEYDPFSYVLLEIIKSGSIKIEQIGPKKNEMAKQLSLEVAKSKFFSKYCVKKAYPHDLIQKILVKFLDILEMKIAQDQKLCGLLRLGYDRSILEEQRRLQQDIKEVKIGIGAVKSDFSKIAEHAPFNKSVAVENELDRSSYKSRYLDVLFKYCLQLEKAKEDQKALKNYRLFLREKHSDKHRKYFAVLTNIGRILHEKGKHVLALKYIKKAYDISPKRSLALLNLGVTHFFLQDYDQALNFTLQAKTKRKRDPYVYNTLSIIYAEKGDWNRAMKMINKAIQIDKKFPPAYVNRAILYGEKKDFTPAIKDAEKAIDLEKDNPKFYVTYGSILQKKFYSSLCVDISIWDKKGDTYYIRHEDLESLSEEQIHMLDETIKSFEKAIELGMDLLHNKVLSVNLAASYQNRQRYKDAERVYKKIKVDRDEDFPWHGLGDLYFVTGRIKSAIRCYKKLLHLHLENHHVHSAIARAYAGLNDLPTSIKHAKKACSLAPEDRSCRFNLGFCYVLSGQLREAQIIFDQLKRENYNIGAVSFHLGRIYFLQEMYSSAAQCFLDAKKHGIPRELFSELLAVSAAASLRNDEAEDEFKFLLTKYPDKFLHNFNYAQLLDRRGDTKDAKSHYVEAIKSSDAKKYPPILAWISKRLYQINMQDKKILRLF